MFMNAMTTKDMLTENGMPTHSTSGSRVLDMFFKQGGSRTMSERELEVLFAGALGENPLLAIRSMFYNRDVRGGQGERRSFRIFLKYLSLNHPQYAEKVLYHVPEYGRWDDLFAAFDTPMEEDALIIIMHGLVEGDRLAAKWMPREGKKGHEYADRVRRFMGLSWKEWRKLLVGNTEVVESLMCGQKWTDIKYSAVPSKAMLRYRKAFGKHDPIRFSEFIGDVKEGKVKINSKALFPHEIVHQAGTMYGGFRLDEALEAQWMSLPDYMPKGRRVLPVSDVSGSMYGLPLEVSIGLGLYVAERNVGPFKNALVTFSESPTFIDLPDSARLHEKLNIIAEADWDMNTNLTKVFDIMLHRAVRANLPAEEMPNVILIISDMQFDRCVDGGNDTALEMIDRRYRVAGYERPQVIFWNVNSLGGVPVKKDEQGTILVSGFSPSILKYVLTGELETPEEAMLRVLNSERYAPITI